MPSIRPRSLAVLTLLALLAAAALRAAPPAADPGVQEGNAALAADDLPRAAKAFQGVVERQPDNAEAWFRLGIAEREMGRYGEAAKAFSTAIDKGYPPAVATTSLAILYVAQKDYDKAFEYLGRAVKLGVQPGMLQNQPGLAAIRDDPRFKALVAAADKASHPCESDPRYRAFDFWVGDWDVYTGRQVVGTNRIERIERGCALVENWTGGRGGTGKSLNYFDTVDGTWRQDGVDDGGEVVHYRGEVSGGAMRMTGESHAGGHAELARGTWTPRPDGSVRQFLERSTDGGKTWTVSFDGLYVKKGTPPPAADGR
jgi:tetratricopeptide repeat protein